MIQSNPYESPAPSDGSRGTRPVRLLVIGGCLLAFAAAFVAIPGAVLFNQETQLIPVTSGIYDIQIGDVTITNTAVIACSGTLCFCLWSMAAGLWGIARRNHSLNQKRTANDPQTH